jgi:hypothetical protein
VEPFYQKCTQILKDEYANTIKNKHLPVDVISYVGDAAETHLDGDTLYIACDNKLSIDKHREVYKYIYEHPEYDVIVKTNVSTVLNLELICKYISTPDFYSHNMYACAVMWDDHLGGKLKKGNKEITVGNFPIGFFHMADYKIWEDIYLSYDEVLQSVLETHNMKTQDINDDLMMGALLLYTGHNVVEIANYIKVSIDVFDAWVSKHPNDDGSTNNIFSSFCVRCKMICLPKALHEQSDYLRKHYEPFMLHFIAKLYNEHRTHNGDMYNFITSLCYRHL